jgi:hypothetical protein
VWIPSIPSSPSLEEPLDAPLPAHMQDGEATVTSVPPGVVTQQQSPVNTDTRSVHRDRPRWAMFALVAGLMLLMVVAAAVGFLIGRGH